MKQIPQIGPNHFCDHAFTFLAVFSAENNARIRLKVASWSFTTSVLPLTGTQELERGYYIYQLNQSALHVLCFSLIWWSGK